MTANTTQPRPLPFEGRLIVSCQPVDDGPLDSDETTVQFASAAEIAGASALRIEGASRVAAVVRSVNIPIIGIVKRDLPDSGVRITPFIEDVRALAAAGATIIAVDATHRRRPASPEALLEAVHSADCLAMADISSIDEARAAVAMGFDIVGTTLSGYTGGAVPRDPDFALLQQCHGLPVPVIAEGRFNSPGLASRAIEQGASCVCVGSAITRPEIVTDWFLKSVNEASSISVPAVLALDIGGSKTLAALVRRGTIIDKQLFQTLQDTDPRDWLAAIATMVPDAWNGTYQAVAAAVTGAVRKGCWTSLNPTTLDIPGDVKVVDLLETAFEKPAYVVNDAQAAAWGEFKYGQAAGRDLVYLTISSGVGGGIVTNGQLMTGARGFAGSMGQIRLDLGADRLETRASGFSMRESARQMGHDCDARGVFDAAAKREDWALRIIEAAGRKIAGLMANLQMIIDPEVIVMGGGVGSQDLFREFVVNALGEVEDIRRPHVVPSSLGVEAGIIGAAELTQT